MRWEYVLIYLNISLVLEIAPVAVPHGLAPTSGIMQSHSAAIEENDNEIGFCRLECLDSRETTRQEELTPHVALLGDIDLWWRSFVASTGAQKQMELPDSDY